MNNEIPALVLGSAMHLAHEREEPVYICAPRFTEDGPAPLIIFEYELRSDDVVLMGVQP